MAKIEFVEYYETTPEKQLDLQGVAPDPDKMDIIPHDDVIGAMEISFDAAKDVAKALAIHVLDGRRLVVKVPNKHTGEMDWKFWVLGKKSLVPAAAEAESETPIEKGLTVVPPHRYPDNGKKKRNGRGE